MAFGPDPQVYKNAEGSPRGQPKSPGSAIFCDTQELVLYLKHSPVVAQKLCTNNDQDVQKLFENSSQIVYSILEILG